jgi:hypothetical protein
LNQSNLALNVKNCFNFIDLKISYARFFIATYLQQLRNDGVDDAADEIERLRATMEEIRHIAEGMRTWNGQGWTYNPRTAERIYAVADSALKPNNPVQRATQEEPER